MAKIMKVLNRGDPPSEWVPLTVRKGRVVNTGPASKSNISVAEGKFHGRKRSASAIGDATPEDLDQTDDKPQQKRFRIMLRDEDYADYVSSSEDDDGSDDDEEDADEDKENQKQPATGKQDAPTTKRKSAKEQATLKQKPQMRSQLQTKPMVKSKSKSKPKGKSAPPPINPEDFKLRIGVYSLDPTKHAFRQLGSAQIDTKDLRTLTSLYQAAARPLDYSVSGTLGGKILIDEAGSGVSAATSPFIGNADSFREFVRVKRMAYLAGSTDVGRGTTIHCVLCEKQDEHLVRSTFRDYGWQTI